MCGTCGCGATPDALHDDPRTAHRASTHGPRDARRGGSPSRQSLLAENDRTPSALARGPRRARHRRDRSPGRAGRRARRRSSRRPSRASARGRGAEAVVEGDCASDLDARRVAAARRARRAGGDGERSATSTPISSGTRSTRSTSTASARLWIENVGNLVCPAAVPAAASARRVVLVSAPEGDDKPEKYPALFAAADLLVVTQDRPPARTWTSTSERCVVARARRVAARPARPRALGAHGAKASTPGSPGCGTAARAGVERVPRGARPDRRDLRGATGFASPASTSAACASASASRRSPEARAGDWVLVHAGVALQRPRRGRGRGEASRCSRGRPERGGAVRFVDEYRDPAPRPRPRRARSAARPPGLDDHGGLRRADPRHPRSTASTSSLAERRRRCCTAPAVRSA